MFLLHSLFLLAKHKISSDRMRTVLLMKYYHWCSCFWAVSPKTVQRQKVLTANIIIESIVSCMFNLSSESDKRQCKCMKSAKNVLNYREADISFGNYLLINWHSSVLNKIRWKNIDGNLLPLQCELKRSRLLQNIIQLTGLKYLTLWHSEYSAII